MKKLVIITILILLYIFACSTYTYAETYNFLKDVYVKEDLRGETAGVNIDLDAFGTELNNLVNSNKNYAKYTSEERENIYINILNYNAIRPDRQVDMPIDLKERVEKYYRKKIDTEGGEYTFPSTEELMDSGSDFFERGDTSGDEQIFTDDEIRKPVLKVGQLLTTIAIAILLITITIMGIKYMVSPPNGRAKLKQQLIGLFISSLVIFGAYMIWEATVNVLENIS